MKAIKLLLTLLLLLVLALFSGCTSNKGGEKTTEISDKPQELQLCSSLGKNMTELLVRDFLKQNKVKINPHVTYIPAGTLEDRLKFIDEGKFDCWLGGSAEEYFIASQHKLLEPYASKEAFKVPLELRNRKNLWTTLYLSHIAIISNKNRLHRLGLYAPTTWNELLEPKLQNEIILPHYNYGGSSFSMITSIWQLRGKEQALKFATQFNQQQPVYTNNVLEAAEAVYKGEKTLAVVPLSYALELEEKHSHLFATVPKDANRNLLTGAAVLNKAANPTSAQKFIDYLIGDTSQAVLQQNQVQHIWSVKDYPNNSGRTELVGRLKVPVDDLAWTSTYKAEIIKQWLEAK